MAQFLVETAEVGSRNVMGWGENQRWKIDTWSVEYALEHLVYKVEGSENDNKLEEHEFRKDFVLRRVGLERVHMLMVKIMLRWKDQRWFISKEKKKRVLENWWKDPFEVRDHKIIMALSQWILHLRDSLNVNFKSNYHKHNLKSGLTMLF